MKTLAIIVLALLVSVAVAWGSGCYLKYSYVSGMNRICMYDCLDGDRALTIGACDLCPLSL